MGLYDRILFEAPCGGCGEKLTEWQTKSAPNPSMRTFRFPPPKMVKGFYSICYCRTVMEFFRLGDSDEFGFACHEGFPSHVFMFDEDAEPPKLGPRKRHGHATPYEPKEEKG